MGSTEDFGRSSPLGATLRDGGVNFSLYSRNASKVELLFFDREDDSNASRIIPINPGPNRTYHYWHTFVPGVQLGQVYGYRVYGPYERTLGFRFDSGRFRDDVRSFFNGADGAVTRVADRLVGSPSIYAHKQREAKQSINFVTCHDGFTLNDLVSYNQKHNEANGEENRDGCSDNRSWNCGAEGPTDDPDIEKLSNRQVNNFLATTLFSLGMPMLLMGDEVRRTQLGNNNAYCQDSEISWFDWSLAERHDDVFRFAQLLIHGRMRRSARDKKHRVTLNEQIRSAVLAWHGVQLHRPDWSDQSHSLALSAELHRENLAFFVILNAFWEPLRFELPSVQNHDRPSWHRWIDTCLESPEDIVPWEDATPVSGLAYPAGPHSVVILISALRRSPTE